MIILYQITQLSEQKYKLAIPFAGNNFGPFEHIVFVIVLFESPSKTVLRVLFASLYLQICIFYQYISISCPIVSSKWVHPNRKYDKKPSKQCDVCIVWPCKGQKWIRKVKLHLHAWVWRHPGHRSFLLANYCAMYVSVSKVVSINYDCFGLCNVLTALYPPFERLFCEDFNGGFCFKAG
jgi:hypothetical protein